jgi:hypothetical protein
MSIAEYRRAAFRPTVRELRYDIRGEAVSAKLAELMK